MTIFEMEQRADELRKKWLAELETPPDRDAMQSHGRFDFWIRLLIYRVADLESKLSSAYSVLSIAEDKLREVGLSFEAVALLENVELKKRLAQFEEELKKPRAHTITIETQQRILNGVEETGDLSEAQIGYLESARPRPMSTGAPPPGTSLRDRVGDGENHVRLGPEKP